MPSRSRSARARSNTAAHLGSRHPRTPPLARDAGRLDHPDLGLLEVFASVPDPCDPRGLLYPMPLLLAIAILAAVGMRGFTGYANWARTTPADLLADLGLTKKYRPSDKSYRQVLALIDPRRPRPAPRRLRDHHRADRHRLTAGRGRHRRRNPALARRVGAAAAHLVSAFIHHSSL
ncbi:transposase family protein [Nocardia sp. Marseille-Q1738]